MYIELTPQDTLRDLQSLLIDSLPNFEFPRTPLLGNYEINTITKNREEATEEDFIVGPVFQNPFLPEEEFQEDLVYIDNSYFKANLTSEEINIIATLMMCIWVQRQVTSIENTRMKYSGADFKFTSQANHMQKILQMKKDYDREAFHLQRLYKRRIRDEFGVYRSTMPTIMDLAPDYKIGGRHTNDCGCQFYDDAIHWHGLDQVDKEAAEDQDHDCHCGG